MCLISGKLQKAKECLLSYIHPTGADRPGTRFNIEMSPLAGGGGTMSWSIFLPPILQVIFEAEAEALHFCFKSTNWDVFYGDYGMVWAGTWEIRSMKQKEGSLTDGDPDGEPGRWSEQVLWQIWQSHFHPSLHHPFCCLVCFPSPNHSI